ncbi:MAG: IS1634 family transposase, partial [Bacillota bacterium]
MKKFSVCVSCLEKFRQYFPEEALPEEEGNFRSSCIYAGAYYVIRKVIQDCGLDEKLGKILGRDAGLFLDFAAYAIMTEDNAAQYYPDYAYNHLLFTEEMRIFSDSTIGEFLQRTTRDQRIEFLNEWNTGRDHRERIYISYDSTNKNCQAGDIDMVEVGHPKEDNGKPIFNVSVAYDGSNREPLFYESYPGSIVDVSQLQYMLGKAQGYGYRHVGFILDRGYFSRENIRYMDKCGYEFVIMMKGMKALVSEVVGMVRGTFEKDRGCSIRSYRVNGTTVSRELFSSDERKRHFHVYYSERKAAAEREEFEQKIDRMAAILKEKEGEKAEFDPVFER